MSNNNYRPWWEKVGEFNTPAEKEEFIRGLSGITKPTGTGGVILAILAGYVGGKIAQRTGKNK